MRSLVLVMLLLLGACNAVGARTEEAAFIEAGARSVPKAARAELLVGNTVVGDGFSVYYAEDGTKRVTVGDRVVQRSWRVGPDGAFCEELAASAVEVCNDNSRLYVQNGLYRAFRPDGSASPLSFRIVSGDAAVATD